MQMIAAASLAGIDPLAFARADSEVEFAYLTLVAEKAIKMQTRQRSDLANRIVAGVAGLFGGKKKSGGDG